ncbi:MAG: PLP-dependent transferase, partial [Sporichthyaceae bacterium]
MSPTPEPPMATSMAVATVAVSAGRPPRMPDGPLNPPIVMASTYHAGGDVGYGRYGNPTWEMLESAVGALEGGVGTSFASGIAAVSAVLELVPPGGVVVAPPDAYYGSLAVLQRLESQGRLTVRRTDLSDAATAADAVRGADLVWVETPTNPMLKLVDLASLADRCAAAGAVLAVDSTFATPILQRPLELGADVVVHSATKYLSGHTDLLLGVAVARDADVATRLAEVRSVLGAIPGTFEAWLVLRGLRTLHLRMERASANAAELATRLGSHAAVSAVHYPGLGAMVSVELHGAAQAAELACDSTEIWVHATSLGGVESSLERRRRWSGESTDVPETLLRLSVGV